MSRITRKQGFKDVTIAGAAVALSTDLGFSEITIQAKTDNDGVVYVGNSLVDDTNGIEIFPTQQITLGAGSLADIYIDSANNGDGVKFLYTES